jgi:hypothetical protein
LFLAYKGLMPLFFLSQFSFTLFHILKVTGVLFRGGVYSFVTIIIRSFNNHLNIAHREMGALRDTVINLIKCKTLLLLGFSNI